MTPIRDRQLAAALAVIAIAQVAIGEPHGVRAIVALQALVATGAVSLRRRAPLLAAAVVALGTLSNLALYGTGDGDFVIGTIVAVLVVTYSTGAHERDLASAAAGGLLVLAAFWFDDLRQRHGPNEYLASAVLVLGAWTAGRLVGAARRQTAELRDAQAALAAAAAETERMRIARELHDVVAHSLTVIALQADAAEALGPSDPAGAARAAGNIRTTAHGALEEMRRLLGGLRETAPPSLRDLDALVAEARTAGAEVTLTVDGGDRALPAAVDVSAYRILQEGMTNARRHAPGTACAVSVRYARAALELAVENAAGPAPTGAQGHGLIGVRERVAALGGELAAGPTTGGGWRLHARLPLP